MKRILFALSIASGLGLGLSADARAQVLPAAATVQVNVTAAHFALEPRTITVKQGQQVRLTVTAADTAQSVALAEYGVDEVVEAGTSRSVEFTAKNAGHFHFHCSVGCDGSSEGTMGTLIVEPTPTAPATQDLPVKFDDQTPGVAIVESGGVRWRIDTNAKTVTRLDDAAADKGGQTPATPPADDKEANEVPHGHEPYDYHLINLPTSKPIVKGSLNLFFTHRFSESVRPIRSSARDLLGLDSFAVSSLGLAYGITDRLYISAYRSPLCVKGLCRTIEIGLGYHLLDEAGKSPLSLSAYASIEGNDNFTEEYTYNLQAMLGRSVTKYVHLFFSPEVSLNANGQHRFNPSPFNFFPPALAAFAFHLPKNTASFGFGLNAAVRPTVSVLFEFTPRIGFKLGRVVPIVSNTGQVTGFFNTSQPEIGFGIEKRIGRHSFALTFSNTQTTTTSRYNSSNLVLPDNKFIIGFNVYRRFLK